MPLPALWFVLLVIFAIVEGATVGLASIWFAAGALAAALLASLAGCGAAAPAAAQADPPPDPEPEAPEQEGEGETALRLEDLTDEVLETMPVVKLRSAARSVELTSMTRKEIRFAKKEELVAAIRAFRDAN